MGKRFSLYKSFILPILLVDSVPLFLLRARVKNAIRSFNPPDNKCQRKPESYLYFSYWLYAILSVYKFLVSARNQGTTPVA